MTKENLKNCKFYMQYAEYIRYPEVCKPYIVYRINNEFFPLKNLFPIIPKYIENLLLSNNEYKIKLALNLL